jgi:hypothetical protein
MSKEDYLRQVGRAYEISPFARELAGAYANESVRRAQVNGLKPYLGGDYQAHKRGKLGEIIFERLLVDLGMSYEAPCLSRIEDAPLSHVDFRFFNGLKNYTADVKTGSLKMGQGFESAYNDSFGMLVPVEQPVEAIVYPYVLLDAMGSRAVCVGFAFRWEVKAAPVKSYDHSCHQVPVPNLHPWHELQKLVSASGIEENVEKLLEA